MWQWRYWLMMGLLLVGLIGLIPNQSLLPSQWKILQAVAIPLQPSAVVLPTVVLPTPAASTAPVVDSAVVPTLLPGVALEVTQVHGLVAAQQMMYRLHAIGLRAYYLRGDQLFENTYSIWIGPYWSTTEAQADMRSLAALGWTVRPANFL
jgi:hypothetical protein